MTRCRIPRPSGPCLFEACNRRAHLQQDATFQIISNLTVPHVNLAVLSNQDAIFPVADDKAPYNCCHTCTAACEMLTCI